MSDDLPKMRELGPQRIRGVGKIKEEKLIEAGYENVEDIADAEVEELERLDGFGHAGAHAIVHRAQELLSDDHGMSDLEFVEMVASELLKEIARQKQ